MNVSAAQMSTVAKALDVLARTRDDRGPALAALQTIRGSSYAAGVAAAHLSVLAPHAELCDSDTLTRYADEWRGMAKRSAHHCGVMGCRDCNRKKKGKAKKK